MGISPFTILSPTPNSTTTSPTTSPTTNPSNSTDKKMDKNTTLTIHRAISGLKAHIRHHLTLLRASHPQTLSPRLASLLSVLSKLALKNPRRASYIDIDALIAIFTAAVLTLTDIDRLIAQPLTRRVHYFLARNANRLATITAFLDKVVAILSSNSKQSAIHRYHLSHLVTDMLQSDLYIAARLSHLQDSFSALKTVQRRDVQPPQYSTLPDKDELPPAYGEEENTTEISPRNWSVFSGLTLKEVGDLKKIALPVLLDEIEHSRLY